MQRRLALAVALAFTTLVTFGVVVFGAQHGVFSDKKASAQDAVVEAPADTPAPEPTVAEPPAQAPAPLEPVVLTRYVYVDDPAPAATAAPPPAAVASTPAASPTATPTRAASPTALPSATPTEVPPTAAPSSTPAATATPAPASVQATEIEFVGTVTAISGNIVTFSHGGQQTDVRVQDPSSLSTGARVHVHAVLKGGVYVAAEIEAGG
jgi:hypothetical protein